VEDQGAIGKDRLHLYRVEIPQDPEEPMNWHVSEEEIRPAGPPTEEELSLAKPEIIDFLKIGGLRSILRAGMTRERILPPVWLTRDTLGNVTFTFVKERGLRGGTVVPRGALMWKKIAPEKRDEVLEFVQTFGLSREEAEDVVDDCTPRD
jgi:hypothetical protein